MVLETVNTSKQLMSELSTSERRVANGDAGDDGASHAGAGATGGAADAPSTRPPQSALAGAAPIHAPQ